MQLQKQRQRQNRVPDCKAAYLSKENNLEKNAKENYNISTIDSNLEGNNKNFRTVNTDDNTTRDTSFIKVKGGAVQQFQKKENLLVLLKLQKCIKRFLRTNPRVRNKNLHFQGNNNVRIILIR